MLVDNSPLVFCIGVPLVSRGTDYLCPNYLYKDANNLER